MISINMVGMQIFGICQIATLITRSFRAREAIKMIKLVILLLIITNLMKQQYETNKIPKILW